MALFSSHTSIVQRSRGQNAVASAAYNARAKLELNTIDSETGLSTSVVYNYAQKGGLGYSKISAPENAPEWVYDREKLWNKAEEVETRKNSQTARKIMLALPLELNEEQQIKLLEEFVNELVSMGMVVDANIHNDKTDNPHAHLMMTTRELTIDHYGETTFSALKNREWSKKAFVNWHRMRWAELQNEHLANHGFDVRVSEKSYKDRDLDLIPGVHEGPARNIHNAELTEINRQIAYENAKRIEENPSLLLDKLALNKPVFTKEEIARELEKYLFNGMNFEGKQSHDIEALNAEVSNHYMVIYAKLMACPELSLVVEKDLKGRELYTTNKRLELEERFIEGIEVLKNRNSHALNISDIDLDKLSIKEVIVDKVQTVASKIAAKVEEKTGIKFEVMKKNPPLSLEQRKAVVNILNGSDISALQGIPGSGKTTAMKEIVRQYKKAGFKVIGVTASSAAALQLAKATGIECRNASMWRKAWLQTNNENFELALRGDYYKEKSYLDNDTTLTNKHVMIVDEASMMELANMDYLTHEVIKAKAKVIQIGDNNQLSAVGWAGAFKKVADICGSENLEESHRQLNPAHREATKCLSQYKIKKALDIYHREGNIIIDNGHAESRGRLINDYIAHYLMASADRGQDNLASIKSAVICTYTNSEAVKLNNEVRNLLKEAGVIKGKEKEVLVGNKKLLLARGEQIVFTLNINKLGRSGIYNGEVGTILSISKPNSLGQASIAIVVNKADGRKEGIVLETKNYNSNNLFDYGYAVTGHKLQGATVDNLFVLHDKQVGYEAFNVMMTRHRSDIKLYASNEHLMNALYESLDLDSEKAKTRYEIEAKAERVNLALAGLVKISSKRTNNNFAHDYFDMGHTAEDKHLKQYIDANSEVIEVIRKISLWQQKELRQIGNKPNIWEHELWEKFKAKKVIRDKHAQYIAKNYNVFSDRIIQLGINYATIEKHASNDNSEKYIVEENQTFLHSNSEHYSNLITIISKAHKYKNIEDNNPLTQLSKSYNNLKLEIAETYAKISDSHTGIKILNEDEHDLKSAIEQEENYRTVIMPAFLSRIYREDPKQILDNFEKLCGEHGEMKAANMVANKITILGTLKGMGIGRITLSTKRDDAWANAENLSEHLIAYNRSSDMEQKLRNEYINHKFLDRISELKKEIAILKNQLPSSLDDAFIDKVEEVVSKKQGDNGLSLLALKDSEIFNSVWVRNVQHGVAEDKDVEKKIEEAVLSVLSQSNKSDAEEKQPLTRYRRQKNVSEPSYRLNYEEVKNAISPAVIESVFKQYGTQLNPDGKIEKKGNQLFCGSLNINLKDGRWYRFSDGSKGDLFALVQEATGGNIKGAFDIIAEHAGIKPRDIINSAQVIKEVIATHDKLKHDLKVDPWQAYDKVPLNAPGIDPKRDLLWIIKKNNWQINDNYEYRNKEGELLGYVIRVIDTDGKKQTLPVTYCLNEEKGISRWQLKGFSDNGDKPIYRAEQLQKDLLKPVLIVEGEKAADHAARLLNDHTVISWIGGAQSTDKVNWSELKGRDVTIWPDNDIAGQKAALSILESINKLNGYSGSVNIVDTSSLNLPEKWDLADELPSHMTLKDINKAIVNSREISLSNNISFNTSEEQKIVWQQNAIGINKSQESIRHEAELLKHVAHVLNKQELIEYMDYGIAKGKAEYEHNFLSLKDPLYREILAASVVRFIKDNEGKESANEIKKTFNLDQQELGTSKECSLAVIVDTVQDIYRKYSSNSNVSFLQDNYKFYKENTELKGQNAAKADLHMQLVKDFSLLHLTQLGVKSLSKTHQDILNQDIAKVIKDYDLNHNGNQRKLENNDYAKIADALHNHINTPSWWQSLAQQELNKKNTESSQIKAKLVCDSINNKLEQLDKSNAHTDKINYLVRLSSNKEIMNHIKDSSIHNKIQRAVEEKERILQDKEFYLQHSLEYNDSKLKEIELFGVKVDKAQLIEKLRPLEDKERDQHIESIWRESFKKYIKPRFDLIKLEKAQCKNMEEMIKVLEKEKELCHHIHKEHNSVLINISRNEKNRDEITANALMHTKHPGFIQQFEQHYNVSSMLGAINEKNILQRIQNSETIHDVQKISNNMFSNCQNHLVKEITRGLSIIDSYNVIEKDNMHFTEHRSYLEHHINNKVLAPYLQNTSIMHAVSAIYKQEEHQKALELELELQKTKTIEKDYGMGGFGR